MNSETFGERIRRLRVAKKMSLRELASALNYDQSSLSKIERNELTAPEMLIRRLANKLGEDYKELLIQYQSERVYYWLKEADYAIESLDLAKRRLELEGQGTKRKAQRAKLLEQINTYFAEQPIAQAWLFGSFARGEESLDSDIDILVKFTQPHKLDLLDYIGIKQALEQLSGRQVDLVEEGYLLPGIKDKVEEEKVLLYEKEAS